MNRTKTIWTKAAVINRVKCSGIPVTKNTAGCYFFAGTFFDNYKCAFLRHLSRINQIDNNIPILDLIDLIREMG